MQKVVQRMVQGFVFASVGVSIGVQRQARDGFGQYPNTRIDGSGLKGGAFVDSLPAGRAAEEKTVGVTQKWVLRFVAGFDESVNNSQGVPPWLWAGKNLFI